MAEVTTIGLDLAKHIFQVHGVDAAERVMVKKRLRRSEVLGFFERLSPCVVAMEACAGAHHWARQFSALGHEVRLIPPSRVKPFVGRQKNDAADAAAICAAALRPSMRFAAVKTEKQQALLLDHRTRDLLIRQRTMMVNALRGHLAEFGIIAAQGLGGTRALLARVAAEDELAGVPAVALPALKTLASGVRGLEHEIKRIEARLKASRGEDERVKRLMSIPGIGIIGATAIAATVPDASLFRSGARLCGLARAGAATAFERRQDTSGPNDEDGRPLHQKAARPGRDLGDPLGQTQARVRAKLARPAARAQAHAPRRSGARQQDRAHRLGAARAWRYVSACRRLSARARPKRHGRVKTEVMAKGLKDRIGSVCRGTPRH